MHVKDFQRCAIGTYKIYDYDYPIFLFFFPHTAMMTFITLFHPPSLAKLLCTTRTTFSTLITNETSFHVSNQIHGDQLVSLHVENFIFRRKLQTISMIWTNYIKNQRYDQPIRWILKPKSYIDHEDLQNSIQVNFLAKIIWTTCTYPKNNSTKMT